MPHEYSMSHDAFRREVLKTVGADQARKQRIFARSPHLAYTMDAASMTSRELAERELAELGITCGIDEDAERLLDVHHAGRRFARDGVTPESGGPIKGGKPAEIFNPAG